VKAIGEWTDQHSVAFILLEVTVTLWKSVATALTQEEHACRVTAAGRVLDGLSRDPIVGEAVAVVRAYLWREWFDHEWRFTYCRGLLLEALAAAGDPQGEGMRTNNGSESLIGQVETQVLGGKGNARLIQPTSLTLPLTRGFFRNHARMLRDAASGRVHVVHQADQVPTTAHVWLRKAIAAARNGQVHRLVDSDATGYHIVEYRSPSTSSSPAAADAEAPTATAILVAEAVTQAVDVASVGTPLEVGLPLPGLSWVLPEPRRLCAANVIAQTGTCANAVRTGRPCWHVYAALAASQPSVLSTAAVMASRTLWRLMALTPARVPAAVQSGNTPLSRGTRAVDDPDMARARAFPAYHETPEFTVRAKIAQTPSHHPGPLIIHLLSPRSCSSAPDEGTAGGEGQEPKSHDHYVTPPRKRKKPAGRAGRGHGLQRRFKRARSLLV
jgi:hypothetical protein